MYHQDMSKHTSNFQNRHRLKDFSNNFWRIYESNFKQMNWQGIHLHISLINYLQMLNLDRKQRKFLSLDLQNSWDN